MINKMWNGWMLNIVLTLLKEQVALVAVRKIDKLHFKGQQLGPVLVSKKVSIQTDGYQNRI
jgi:hypothetical protein